MSSRLPEYGVWNRLHALGAGSSHGSAASNLIGRLDLVELSPVFLDRVLHLFPVAVRTLDALHLAAAVYMHVQRSSLQIATYDLRMAAAVAAVGLPLFPLPP